MRKIFVLQVIIVFYSSIIAYASSPAGFPEEFSEIQAEDHEIVGYGEGKTLEEAAANAKNEIATTIQYQASLENEFKQGIENGKYTENKKVTKIGKTNVVLTGLETVRRIQRGGKWYVAVKFDKLPLEKKFVKRMKRPCSKEKQNRYLQQTPLIKTINKELNCKPDIKVVRKYSMWNLYLSYDQIMLPLSNEDFERLFNRYDSDAVSLIPSGELFTEGSVLTFTASVKQDGYVSLLDVYENGEVFIISSNQSIKANKKIIMPDPSIDQELVCGLLTPGKQANDLYVVVYSKNKIDLSRIQQVGKMVEKDEEHFKFGELLDMLDEHEFSSVLIRTKPKGE